MTPPNYFEIVVPEAVRNAAFEFIKQIFGAQATDNTDALVCRNLGGIVTGYRPDGGVICSPKPTPLPNTPSIAPIPSISQPPTVIYDDSPTNIVINVTYPQLPERRLSNRKLPTGGGTSNSVLKKVITVNTAIKNASYGHLLHEPITNSPVALQVCMNNEHSKALEAKQKIAAEKFFDGLFAAQQIINPSTPESNVELPEPSYSMSDVAVALVASANSKAGALFGIEGINDFISSFLERSFVGEMPITGVIPLNYEYVECTHKENQISDLVDNLEVLNIKKYIESLGLDSISNQVSSLSPKNNNTIGTSNTEYLDNQLTSLSVKSSKGDSAELTGIEYLHNQLISSSIKISSTDITKLLKIVGIDDFPITVPESILTKIGDNKQQNQIATKQIQSLTQFIHWFFERVDEVSGQWEIPIEIKDTDPTTPGDQSKMLKVPNMAEAFATIIELLLQISINSELDINMNTRMMLDIGQDKKQNFISYKTLDAIADYLGFAFKEKEVKLPMMFTPEKEDFSEMLQECEIPVAVMELNEKHNFQADLVALKEAARIIKAVHFTKLNPKADIKQQIMDRLKSFRDLGEGINNKEDSDDLDEFLEAWQLGYTNTTGVGDATKPYGRDFEDRPRYRRIKKVDSNDPA